VTQSCADDPVTADAAAAAAAAAAEATVMYAVDEPAAVPGRRG